VGSFHTDLLDLLKTHNANAFQSYVVALKERVDSHVLDSCATTSSSFSAKLKLQGVHCEHIISTAVDTQTFVSSKKSKLLRDEMTFGDTNGFLCVYVGRISREKRIDVIANAVAGVEGAYLAIVGDGPNAAQYTALHGPESRIYCKPRFLSHAELAEVYASSDVHVSGSEFETLGNTVLESFACSVPVIVPRTQGFQDTVDHEYTGYLFTPGDEEMARTYIQKLKDDETLRRHMGERGRQIVSHKTVTHVVKELTSWYEKGIHNRQHLMTIKFLISLWRLFISVPFAIISLATYDLLMKILLVVFGYSPLKHKGLSAKSLDDGDDVLSTKSDSTANSSVSRKRR
jgi:glycosyltransferase involved in cell wall biosynthesis